MLFKKKEVEFLELNDFRQIVSPLAAKAYEIINKLIDRYIDYKMKELIKAKINEEKFDENTEIKLRWLLEFREFLNKLDGKK